MTSNGLMRNNVCLPFLNDTYLQPTFLSAQFKGPMRFTNLNLSPMMHSGSVGQ